MIQGPAFVNGVALARVSPQGWTILVLSQFFGDGW
jgi:hypothetical protein